MKLKLIKVKEYLLLIDEEAKIKDGNIAIHDFGMGYNLEIPCDKDNLKSNTRNLVVAYYPLTKEAEELDLPLLPPFEEVDIQQMADNWFEKQGLNIYNSYDKRPSFIEGYKAAQSKQFSLEDMKKAIEMAREGKLSFKFDNEGIVYKHTPEEIIQSLSTQQLPKEFIPEYEKRPVCRSCNKQGYRHCAHPEECGGWIEMDFFKTITNSEGKQVLVGIVGGYKF